MDLRRMKPKQKPKVLPMDKKVKPNPRYQNVQPVTDTGNNTRKQLERVEELRQFYRFRPDEVFRRVTVSSLVGLMIEVSKLEYQEEDAASISKSSSVGSEFNNDLNSSISEHDIEERVSFDPGFDIPLKNNEKSNQAPPISSPLPIDHDVFESVVVKGKMMRRSLSTQSQLQSSLGDLIAGIGNVEISRPHNQQLSSSSSYHHQNSWKAASLFNYDDGASVTARTEVDHPIQPLAIQRHDVKLPDEEHLSPVVDRPFLLLDVRQPEDFERGHIIMARSYPASRLTRAVNFETREMIHFKNKEGKLIVVYDHDESISHKFATTLVQRGYDNVFMLSGGIRITQAKFPNCLIRCKSSDQEEQFSEAELQNLEAFLEDTQASGVGRMSSMSSMRLHSRLQSSLSNLPSISGGSVVGMPHSKRTMIHSPMRSHVKSTGIGRS